MVKSWGRIFLSGPMKEYLWTPSSLPYLVWVLDQEIRGASCYFMMGRDEYLHRLGRSFCDLWLQVT